MNGITILIWITIAIIGLIAIILVRLHYKGDELENDEKSIIPSSKTINGMLSQGKEKISSTAIHKSSSKKTTQATKSLYGNQPKRAPDYDVYIVPEEHENMRRYHYESENQVLINYGNEVKKFQEPIKQSQMDIMNQNNEDKTELKDLFTIDELIKESKRKDDAREKESQKIKREEDAELTEIKESIRKRQENIVEEPLIEEIIAEDEVKEVQPGIADVIEEEIKEEAEVEVEAKAEVEAPSTSQKDIDEVITSASQESEEEEIESISEDKNITDVLLSADNDDLDIPNEEIKEPTLKTPTKVDKTKDYKFGAPIDDADLFEDDNGMDLDYRKDLDKITNKITGSKIFQEVKEKLTPETEEEPQEDIDFIKNVHEYDEYEPIINETHVDYEDMHDDYDQRLRQANTRRVFNMAKNSPEPELAQPKISSIKEKPARDNIKININNNEVVLKKGDEIIFNHQGETYSSQVYGIAGDDISVRYRRKNITIKPEDVKKVY